MKEASHLPNLLDHHISQPAARGLIEDLRQVRKNVYEAWVSRCRSHRLHRAIQKTLDDAVVLTLAVEYLRRSTAQVSHVPEIEDFVTKPSIDEMARLAGPTKSPSWARMSSFLEGKMVMPIDIRRLLFTQLLPGTYASRSGELPVTILGDFHQMCLSSPLTCNGGHDDRRAKGAHYTPASLVDYMVTRALGTLCTDDTRRGSLHVLDPSCGCGAFLVAVLRHIRAYGNESPPFVLHGSDLDKRAVTLAGLSLSLAALAMGTYCGSGLIPRLVRDRKLWASDFLASSTWQNQEFDLIIGGPPFVRVEQLHRSCPELVREYRKAYVTAQDGQFDLYMPFVEKSVNLLRPGGCLAFSVSNGFLRNNSGAQLRRFLNDHCAVEEIIEFEDDSIYPDASVQVAVLLARKADARVRTRYVFVPKKPPLREQLERLCRSACRSVSGSKVIRARLGIDSSDVWSLHCAEDEAFLRHMDEIGTALGRLPVHVSLGLCTGADDIFLLKPDGRPNNGTTTVMTREGRRLKLESKALSPIRRSRQSAASSSKAPEHVCVFPYEQNGEVLAEEPFRKSCPLAYDYLLAHRPRLRSRRLCPDQPWYALRKVDVASHFGKAKVFAPTVCSPGGFLLDMNGTLCHHSLLTITPQDPAVDPHYLLGLLNSAVLWRYISLRTARMGSERRVLRLGAAKHLPIVLPQTPSQRALGAQIIRQCKRLGPKAPVEDLVRELYAL